MKSVLFVALATPLLKFGSVLIFLHSSKNLYLYDSVCVSGWVGMQAPSEARGVGFHGAEDTDSYEPLDLRAGHKTGFF